MRQNYGTLMRRLQDLFEELERDRDGVERDILRVDSVSEPIGDGARYWLVVSAIVYDRIVQFRMNCGEDDLDPTQTGSAGHTLANNLRQVREDATRLGFDVRSGEFRPL